MLHKIFTIDGAERDKHGHEYEHTHMGNFMHDISHIIMLIVNNWQGRVSDVRARNSSKCW